MIEGVTLHDNVLPADVIAHLWEWLQTLSFTRTDRGIIYLSRALQSDNTNNEQAHSLIALLKSHGVDQYISFDDVSIVKYDHGQDYVDWHYDQGPLLETGCAMGLISLGATREIQFRRKDAPDDVHSLTMEAGSLVVSREGFQHDHEHRVPPYETNEMRLCIVLFTHNKQQRKRV